MVLYKDYKEFFEREFELEYHDIHAVREQINELITALAEAQVWKVRYLANNIKLRETRDEAAGKLIRTEESWNKTIDEVVALRAQLAEAQAEVVGRKESNKRYHKQMQGECYE